jgi:hypothetical protein
MFSSSIHVPRWLNLKELKTTGNNQTQKTPVAGIPEK